MAHHVEHSADVASAPRESVPPAGDEPRGPSVVRLRDAKLGGGYREETGELFRGMRIDANDVVGMSAVARASTLP